MPEIHFTKTNLQKNKLSTTVNVPHNLRKYLLSNSIFLNFDSEIKADESIQNIPFVTTVIPLAWLTGTDIKVDKLDKSFLESVKILKNSFTKMYPSVSFESEIHVGEVVENSIEVDNPSSRTGLMFSGGIDSTYSLFTNLKKRPKLITIWGVDGYPYPENREYWNNVKITYSTFAQKKGLDLHIIETDAIKLLYTRRIEHDFHKELIDGSLWVRFQFALFMLPLAAPLSINRFDNLFLAAGHGPSYEFAYGPEAIEPIVDNIFWADLRSNLDGFIPRNHKVSKLKELSGEKITLRVCQKHNTLGSRKLNCSSCEKCYRTILPLLLSDLDPNQYGFMIDESTFHRIRSYFEAKNIPALHIYDQWQPIQEMVPAKIETDYYESRDFFEWFKNYNLSKSEKDVWYYLDIYNKLPWPLAKMLDEIYKRNKINIHDHSPLRKTVKSVFQ